RDSSYTRQLWRHRGVGRESPPGSCATSGRVSGSRPHHIRTERMRIGNANGISVPAPRERTLWSPCVPPPPATPRPRRLPRLQRGATAPPARPLHENTSDVRRTTDSLRPTYNPFTTSGGFLCWCCG